MTKTCAICNTEKPIDMFSKNSGFADGHLNRCKECRKVLDKEFYENNKVEILAKEKEKRDANPLEFKKKSREAQARFRENNRVRIRNKYIEREYNLKPGEFEERLKAQGERCAICQFKPAVNSPRLAVDHCYTTGLARGLLCFTCNAALGHFGDEIEILERAITYLKEKCNGHSHVSEKRMKIIDELFEEATKNKEE